MAGAAGNRRVTLLSSANSGRSSSPFNAVKQMRDSIRRLSLQQASDEVRALASTFATSNGLQGPLLHVVPDDFSTEKEGKTNVHWAAVFANYFNGHEVDGPIVLRVNLRDREVKWATED